MFIRSVLARSRANCTAIFRFLDYIVVGRGFDYHNQKSCEPKELLVSHAWIDGSPLALLLAAANGLIFVITSPSIFMTASG